MIDKLAFGDVQSVTVGVCFLPDAHVDVVVFDVDCEWEHGTPGGFPVVFGMERTEPIVTEEIAGVLVYVDIVVPVFFLASDEVMASKLFDSVVERFPLCEFEEVPAVEENAVVTTPRAVGHALEREVRIELHDRLTVGMYFDAGGAGHGVVSRRVA